MSRNVKGTLFVDYVRMLRAFKEMNWKGVLQPEDLPYLKDPVVPDSWYPMATFERFGVAILRNIASNDLELVRRFGRASVAWLQGAYPELMAPYDPRETLMRFHVLRRSFFDYAPVEVSGIHDGEAVIEIAYQMGPVAEEAASFQTLGFFEQLIEDAGATDVASHFTTRGWAGDPVTTLVITWKTRS